MIEKLFAYKFQHFHIFSPLKLYKVKQCGSKPVCTSLIGGEGRPSRHHPDWTESNVSCFPLRTSSFQHSAAENNRLWRVAAETSSTASLTTSTLQQTTPDSSHSSQVFRIPIKIRNSIRNMSFILHSAITPSCYFSTDSHRCWSLKMRLTAESLVSPAQWLFLLCVWDRPLKGKWVSCESCGK